MMIMIILTEMMKNWKNSKANTLLGMVVVGRTHHLEEEEQKQQQEQLRLEDNKTKTVHFCVGRRRSCQRLELNSMKLVDWSPI